MDLESSLNMFKSSKAFWEKRLKKIKYRKKLKGIKK